MAKDKEVTKPDISPAPKAVEQVSGCVVCGQYGEGLEAVAGSARAHAICAASRPDVIAKVKARA